MQSMAAIWTWKNNTGILAVPSVAAPSTLLRVSLLSLNVIGLVPLGESASSGRASVIISGGAQFLSETKWDGSQIFFGQDANDGLCSLRNSTISPGGRYWSTCRWKLFPDTNLVYSAQFNPISVRCCDSVLLMPFKHFNFGH